MWNNNLARFLILLLAFTFSINVSQASEHCQEEEMATASVGNPKPRGSIGTLDDLAHELILASLRWLGNVDLVNCMNSCFGLRQLAQDISLWWHREVELSAAKVESLGWLPQYIKVLKLYAADAETLRVIGQMQHLVSLEIHSNKFLDPESALAHLATLRLRTLILNCKFIEGVGHVIGLRNLNFSQLEKFSAKNVEISAAQLVEIGEPRLTSLSVKEITYPGTTILQGLSIKLLQLARVSEEMLAGIGTIRSLTSLDITESDIPLTLAGVCSITRLSDLTSLRLSTADRTITKELAGLKSLRQLCLWITANSAVPALLTEHLPTTLESLVLAGHTAVSDYGLLCISRLPLLRSLRIMGDNFTVHGLASLQTLSTLTSLAVTSGKFTDQKLRCLARKPITALAMCRSANISIFGWEGLSLSTSLRELHVRSANGLTDEILKYIAKLPLYLLSICGSQSISDFGIKELSVMHSLRSFYIEDCPLVTDEFLNYLPAALTTLGLIGLNVTNVGVYNLAKHLTLLKRLTLYSLDIDDYGLSYITQNSLEKLVISGCNVTAAGLQVIAQMRYLKLFGYLAQLNLTQEEKDNFVNMKSLFLVYEQ